MPISRPHRLLTTGMTLALSLGCSIPSAEAAAVPDAASVSRSIEATAAAVTPSVVQVLASGYAAGRSGGASLVSKHSSTGSGVVVSADGHIITNAHVVLGSERIELVTAARKTPDGAYIRGQRVRAKLLGVDIDSDIAVLVAPLTDPHPLTFADSSAVQPGQLALALGSPLGLEGSVSLGIVSAVDRQPDPEAAIVYLQTDASINPGSSGGPLVDARGRMIGINTFILSQSGGSQGLGFAVPSNTVQAVYEQLRDLGRVVHGTVGIHVQTVTPTLAARLQLPAAWGALVTDIHPNGPAAAAELRTRDIIARVDGVAIESAREFNGMLHALRPGTMLKLDVVRGAGKGTVKVELEVGARPGDPGFAANANPKDALIAPLGILGITVDDALRQELGGLRADTGVFVAVVSDGPASAMIDRGDVILGVDTMPVRSIVELRRALAAAPVDQPIAIERERDGVRSYVLVELD